MSAVIVLAIDQREEVARTIALVSGGDTGLETQSLRQRLGVNLRCSGDEDEANARRPVGGDLRTRARLDIARQLPGDESVDPGLQAPIAHLAPDKQVETELLERLSPVKFGLVAQHRQHPQWHAEQP